ncbi:MAG: sulfate ABC transporter permease subunit [Deltaproteobacteria bacterium]|nr:sulfate ABC transporter permease subunit [Deltaproteobacteria bacterium]
MTRSNATALVTPSRRRSLSSRGRIFLRVVTAGYLGVLIALPLLALLATAFEKGVSGAILAIVSPEARAALWLTLWTGGLVAILSAILGTLTAWVLVRYRFPGRAVISALVDLPLAVPTLVTGLMLILLLGPTTPLGDWLNAHGLRIIFAKPAIILALLFVTLPLVVRTVEPVLREIDPAEEESAATLGASPLTIFRRVLFPALWPAIAVGTLQTFARALGEFGSVVIISGNLPRRTMTAPVHIFGAIESGEPHAAAAVSVVLVAVSVALFVFAEHRLRARPT